MGKNRVHKCSLQNRRPPLFATPGHISQRCRTPRRPGQQVGVLGLSGSEALLEEPIQSRQTGMKSGWLKSRMGVRGSNPEQREGWVKGGRLVKGTGTKLLSSEQLNFALSFLRRHTNRSFDNSLGYGNRLMPQPWLESHSLSHPGADSIPHFLVGYMFLPGVKGNQDWT